MFARSFGFTSAVSPRQGEGSAREAVRVAQRPLETSDIRAIALEAMNQGLCVLDRNQDIVLANANYAKIYGLDEDEVVAGTPLSRIIQRRIAKGIYAGISPQDYLAQQLQTARTAGIDEQQLSNGRRIRVVRKVLNDGWMLITHEDVTDQRIAGLRYQHLAEHDVLTGLKNRLGLREHLDRAIQQAMRGQGIALHWINIDNFQRFNDNLGHEGGDILLKEIAARLVSSACQEDIVARLGDDEFAVLQKGAQTAAAATFYAERLQKLLQAPMTIGGDDVTVSCSIGTSIAPADALDSEQLSRNCGIALQSAKALGNGSSVFFRPEMGAKRQKLKRIERELRQAMENDELKLYYQPIINLQKRQITGAEALVRWRKPSGEIIPPADFIPVAEESGLIRPMGTWILRRACRDAATWAGDMRVAVNLSGVQFTGNAMSKAVSSALAESGLAARRLELEITESIFLGDNLAVKKDLMDIKGLGVRVVMDDFGTGYSSLSLLNAFAWDKVKIDRQFVKDIEESRQSRAILRSIVSLGLDLDITTTAEGVETAGQLRIAARERCAEIQGFYFSPGVPLDQFADAVDGCKSRLQEFFAGASEPA